MLRYRVHLQFFASDAQEKTEKATPKKKQDIRKKGQVAKSQEVSTALIMLFVFILLLFFGSWLGDSLTSIYRRSFTDYMLMDLTVYSTSTLFREISVEAAKAVAPIMLMALVAGVFGNYLQIGFLFSTDPIKMKLEKVNPIKGFKRIFSTRALVEFLKSMIKIVLIGTVAFTMLWNRKDEVFLLSQKSVGNAITLIGTSALQIGIAVAILLLFLSILDYLYQRYDFEKQNRMSKQEVKDEHKKTEGDPLIKSKIKQKQRQMSMQRMMQDVPKADVIITNPTHFACALKYDGETMDAPILIAKGTDLMAKRIRDLAEEHDIIITENKPLARALYADVEIGEAVPEHLFKAVAEVLAYVYQVQGKV